MRITLDAIHVRISIRHWLNTLDVLTQENNAFKQSLSEVLKGNIGKSGIAAAEQFQQRSIDKDQLLYLMRHDIITLLEQLDQRTHPDNDAATLSLFQSLERDIQQLRSAFSEMKTDFCRWLNAHDAIVN